MRVGVGVALQYTAHDRCCHLLAVTPDDLELKYSKLETRCKLAGLGEEGVMMTSSGLKSHSTRPLPNEDMFRLESKIASIADKLDPVGVAALGSVSRRDFRVIIRQRE